MTNPLAEVTRTAQISPFPNPAGGKDSDVRKEKESLKVFNAVSNRFV